MIELDDDRALVALLDGELDAAEAGALESRLGAEPALRARLDLLKDAARPIGPAFDFLLGEAPAARMAARLAAARLVATPRWRSPLWQGAAAAAVGAALFAGGFGAARLASPPPAVVASHSEDDWRAAVVEYMALYTADSFGADVSPTLHADLASLGARLGVTLSPDKLALAGLSLRRAEVLRYDGAPLLQIGYVADATPVAFCVIGDGEEDTQRVVTTRAGFATAAWAKGGRGFMLIGKLAPARIDALARELEARI